ncbi:glycoside hydrolase family 10 protein [Rufibacter tibetensis]|uniref:Glycoside hydrolase n=1 Tax=Rufibacter tibetensis TaxID=512763 RepID=A0A0P0CRE7_9BACT|nr:family 10 glycosylhydrolase [Rufibacter tibetensis]ALI99025.1 glycoside hydrolase [Rufibacter tibetensis]
MKKPFPLPKSGLLTALLCLLIFFVHAQPSPKREFRGVWIATVANIDWPSQKGLSPVTQMEEFRYILDEHQKTGINAVVVQVRPTTDALYRSKKELWSHWLTGKQGQEPNPPYDPLAFQIEEAHKRGMEFHAWFNPYRATHDTISANISPQHITKTRPEWFIQYGGKYYFKPGLPEVRAYIIDVIMDVVRHYDIDAVHFDDYFYPYPTKDPFPDDEDFAKYGTNFTNKDDWRRYNVDEVIRVLSERIKKEKPYVKFGISPFGIWRNKTEEEPRGSDSKGGITNYDHLYADIRGWLEKGWIDYNVPQIYFHLGHPVADYGKLLDWWSKNSFGKHLYVGHGPYKINNDRVYKQWSDPRETGRQIRLNRQTPDVHGSVYFSSKSVMANPNGVQDSLRQFYYANSALLPTMPWLDSIPPLVPTHLIVQNTTEGVSLRWTAPAKAADGNEARYYAIYRVQSDRILNPENPAHLLAIHHGGTTYTDTSAKPGENYIYAVTAVDRLHNESALSYKVGGRRKK